MPTIDGGGRDQRIKEALEKKVICRRCQVEMVPNPHFLTIWGTISTPRSYAVRSAAEVYLPEALVKGRMADVERELEDK